jgi:hypothetical protein
MPQALAGVLVFRLVSFWLPTLLGAAAWLHICHNGRDLGLVALQRQ